MTGTLLRDVEVAGRRVDVRLAGGRVAAVAPASRTVSWTGTPALDIAAGVVEQLRGLGVEVTWVPGCTREQPELYSHRREQPTGRCAGVVVRR